MKRRLRSPRWWVQRAMDVCSTMVLAGGAGWALGTRWGRGLLFAGFNGYAAVFVVVGVVTCVYWQWEDAAWIPRVRGWWWRRKLRRDLARRDRA